MTVFIGYMRTNPNMIKYFRITCHDADEEYVYGIFQGEDEPTKCIMCGTSNVTIVEE